ncbi:hypothetical protein [Dactylosporangium matsuzakiense]|uniref:Uncharacterized protein n=1 Tax=Dactylosporangium matsuzakiense TaxID=53360 RepID=A0A9W6NQ29_9ACTN|nr:hypothetical protein [Dactylosporangium matsuzakiense]GLL05099.1 hypothetical protein GCM10017581_068460 [Dactylosporangium matsuzakiense]
MTWRIEIPAYLRFVLAVVSPGRPVPQFDAHTMPPAPIDAWSDDEKKLLIEEGRRQLDRQATDFGQLQTRAQILLTTGIAIAVGWLATLSTVLNGTVRAAAVAWLFLILSALMILLSTLGATSIIIVRAEFGIVHATLLSQSQPPILDHLAAAYARTVRVGGNTIATRLSVLRYSVLCLLIASALTGVAWAAARPAPVGIPTPCSTATPATAIKSISPCPSGSTGP